MTPQSQKYVIIITTTDSLNVANKICQHLLQNKLCACAQISSVDSMYLWNGGIETSKELKISIKTQDRLAKIVFDEIKSSHNYTTPQIIKLPILDVSPEYSQWIDDSVESKSSENHNN